jgi:hypothetical protein
VSKKQEVIDDYLERMKNPALTQQGFEDLADRIDRLKAEPDGE